jgi:signal transduction histidine kinase
VIGFAERVRIAERQAIAEEIASRTRHDVRNRLASIRNAVYYLARRVNGTAPWESDKRVPQFFALIDSEVDATEALLAARGFEQRDTAHETFSLASAVRAAIAFRTIPSSVLQRVDVDGAADVRLKGDSAWAALAVLCLVDNAVEAIDAQGSIDVIASCDHSVARVLVRDDGAGLEQGASVDSLVRGAHKPGHAGLGLAIAQRSAARWDGRLTLRTRDRGVDAELSFRCETESA